jgi:hypothetical protein
VELMRGAFGLGVALAMLASSQPQPAVQLTDQAERAAGDRAAAAAMRQAQWFHSSDSRWMSPHELVRRGRQRRRALQTHPGKRGRR